MYLTYSFSCFDYFCWKKNLETRKLDPQTHKITLCEPDDSE